MNNNEYTFEEQLSRMTRLLLRERLRGAWTYDGQDAWRKRLLGLIKAHPHMTVNELAELMSRRMPGGEELLLGLEKKGYLAVNYGDSSGDGAVELTELGRKETAEMPEIADLFSVLSEVERENMRGYMTRIIDNLEKKVEAEDKSESHPVKWPDDFWGIGGNAGFDRIRKMHDCLRDWTEMREPFPGSGGSGCRGEFWNRGF